MKRSRFVKKSRERILDGSKARTALGNLLLDLARYGEAEPHLRAALALSTKPGEGAAGFNNLATLLRATNRMADAEPLYRRALVIHEQSYGPEEPGVAAHLNNLALLLKATGRMMDAEPLYRRALVIAERSHGPDHADMKQQASTTWRTCSTTQTE